MCHIVNFNTFPCERFLHVRHITRQLAYNNYRETVCYVHLQIMKHKKMKSSHANIHLKEFIPVN